MLNTAPALLPIAGADKQQLHPALFLSRVIARSREFCDLMDTVYRLSTEQPMDAAEKVREASTFLEQRIEGSASNQSARAYLSRWAFMLEDRATHRICREAIEDAHLRRPVAEPS